MATIVASDNEFPKIIYVEGAAPSAPPAGFVYVYAKADGRVYGKDDTGTEFALNGATAEASIAAHMADTSDAHDASAISVLDAGGNFTGTDVEAVLAELDAAISGGGIPATIIDAKGDLIVGTAADTAARLAAGTNGLALVADSAQTEGVKYGYASARAARAARGTNQSISNATWTAAQFTGTDTFDTHSIHDPSTNNGQRFVLNQVGLWALNLQANFVSSGSGDRYLVAYLNGSQYGVVTRFQGNATIGNYLRWADVVEATAITDYIECMVHQDSGGALNMSAAICIVQYLGPA